jgi:hypothetical protein
MDKIINYLLLVIIFVFDPLAIALVIAANFAFAQLKTKEEDKIKEKNKPIPVFVDPETGDLYYDIEDKVSNNEEQEEIKEWDVTLNDGLEDLASEFELIDEDKQYDLDGDGKLSNEELLAKRADEDRLLNNQSISGWRKKKILDSRKNDEGEIKTY